MEYFVKKLEEGYSYKVNWFIWYDAKHSEPQVAGPVIYVKKDGDIGVRNNPPCLDKWDNWVNKCQITHWAYLSELFDVEE